MNFPDTTDFALISYNFFFSLQAMRKGIDRSKSFDIRRRSSSKRDRISDENTPVLSKRRKPFFNVPTQIDVSFLKKIYIFIHTHTHT